jgi:hypothetical protein
MDYCDVTFRLPQNIGALSTKLNHTTSQNNVSLYIKFIILRVLRSY